MSHNATEIKSALWFRLATPDVRGFKEHCQRLGLESAERCVMLAMDDVILLFERKMQSYYERKLIELRDDAEAKAIAFAEWCTEMGWEKHIEENTWKNRMGYATEYPTEQLYNMFLKNNNQ